MRNRGRIRLICDRLLAVHVVLNGSICLGRATGGAARDAADLCRPRDRESHCLDHFTVERAWDDVFGV